MRGISGWWKIGAVRNSLITRTALAAVLAVACITGPPETGAQERSKRPRIGVLGPRTRADAARYNDAFLQGLHELGWVEGKNVTIEYRWADGRAERLPALAAELVRLNVDVIFAGPTSAAVAAKSVTDTVPIVIATGVDALELGLVASLARPGGNVTGLAWDVGLATFGKGLELLKECLPRVRRVAILSNPDNRSHPIALRDVVDRGRSLGLQLQPLSARDAAEIDQAFAAMTRERAEAVLVMADSGFGFRRAQLHELAAKRRLPAMYGLREHTETGGLMSYGVDARENFRRAASYVDKILKGATPAGMPMEQPTKFDSSSI